jgi:hypothetical protein
MHSLRDVLWQPVLSEVVWPHCKGPAVAVRDDERLVMHRREQLLREKVKEARKEHRLNVRDELGLTDETVEAGRLLKTLRKNRSRLSAPFFFLDEFCNMSHSVSLFF